jgi:hypothetical protein
MALQELPSVAVAYGAAQRRQRNAALYEIEDLWRRVGTADITSDFLNVAPELFQVANATQDRLGAAAVEYVPQVLEATGQSKAITPRFDVASDAMTGYAGSGVGTEVIAYGAVTRAKAAIEAGVAPSTALYQGGQWLTAAFGTVFADTSRMTEGMAGFARPVSGYVRMLNGESCGRCIILAGKFYRKNAGFKRHPGCDCRHIPASENLAGDMTTNPIDYLDELDDDRLAKALGSKANARAYNDGADPGQLINAYRQPGGSRGPGGIPSIKTAQVYGKDVKYTLEGTTRRGMANYQMREVRALSRFNPARNRREATAVRLMPESIYSIARDQAHADQMLRDFGWIVRR